MIDIPIGFWGLLWIVCGVLAYGMDFAYNQREYPRIAETDYRRDMVHALTMGLLGIIGFIGVVISTSFGKHGFKLR